jgi:hypothetical protein
MWQHERKTLIDRPIPDISITKLPRPLLSFSAEGVATAADAPSIIAGPSRVRSSKGEKVPELDARPFERALSKREKAAVRLLSSAQASRTDVQQPRKATASELWSTLPAPKADLLPQMKRDYQALSLANSLDPKRFMKGGNRSGKIPETFAVSLPPSLISDSEGMELMIRLVHLSRHLVICRTLLSRARNNTDLVNWYRVWRGMT